MSATPKVTVGFLPWWPQNPYQALLKHELNALGIRVIGNPPLSLLRVLVGRDGLDVVHVHWPHGLYKTLGQMMHVLVVLLAYRLIKNNIIWTVHELAAYESAHPRRDAWFRSAVMRLSRHLIVHGLHTQDLVRGRHGYRRGVTVSQHPSYGGWYKDDITRSQARQALGLPSKALVYLYFGYVKPYKGVEDLIQAFRRLPGEDYTLLVVGKPLDAAIKDQIEGLAAMDPRVKTRLAYIADDEIQTYFRAADVAVFPFRETQTSGSLMLALTFGCPVVVPNIATLSEYVDGDIGILYDPVSSHALEKALLEAAAAPLETMASNAERRAEELDWGRMAGAHRAAYQLICPVTQSAE